MKALITFLATWLVAAQLHADGFSLADANTSTIDRSKWQCKSCSLEGSAVSGDARLGIGAVDSDNDQIVNKFGSDDGGFAVLDARVNGRAGTGRYAFRADNLGTETGNADATYRAGGWGVDLGYAKLTTVESDTAVTPVSINGEVIGISDGYRPVDLEQERERVDLGLDYEFDLHSLELRAFADVYHETRQGDRSSSIGLDLRPANYAEPIDYTTTQYSGGVDIKGDRWASSVLWTTAVFDNDQRGLYAESGEAAKALAPENKSNLLLARANYSLGKTRIDVRLGREWLEQEENYITSLGVPNGITHYNGDVDVLKGGFKLGSRLSRRVKLAARYDYYDRENNSPVFEFDQRVIDGESGDPKENVRYDKTRHRVGLDSYWRLPLGIALDAGYLGEFIERSPASREDTDEHSVYLRARYSITPLHRLRGTARYSVRDGSDYRSLTADNNELRQYHLADRDRWQFEGAYIATPLDELNVELKLRYSDEDYDDTRIGLGEVEDYGYDLTANYRLHTDIDLTVFGGQQWVDRDQFGSEAILVREWSYETDDRYDYVGAGLRWDGLLADRLSLGADYVFSESDSETQVDPGEDYGDYYQWSHSTRLFAEYQWTETTSVRLDYRYERHRDFNFADVTDDAISGLTTLGVLGDRYNAQLLMVSVRYSM